MYEAVAIWAFYEFLVIYLGGRQHMAAILESKPRGHHLAPFCCMQGWDMHIQFYHYTRLCVIQYIPIQVAISIIIFVTSLTGNYHDGHFAADDAYIYTAFVVNCSQIAALYGLVEFYQQLKHDLAPTRPFYKFLCIKLVVFFTFWQSVFLSMLVAVNVITPTVTYTTNQESYGIDDFVICVEMFFFAIAHWLAFPPREFENYTAPDSVRAVTQEAGSRTGIGMDWMDIYMYKNSDVERAKGVLEVGEGPAAAGGKAVPDWSYARTEDSAGTNGSAAGGEVQMTQLNGAPTTLAHAIGHGADARVQPMEMSDSSGVSAAQQGAAVPLPTRASVTDATSKSDSMMVTDVS